MRRALSLFAPLFILIGLLVPAGPASAAQLCPAQITGCGCKPIIYPGYPIIPVHPIGPVHPAIACIII